MPPANDTTARLEPISRQEAPILANLFELYVHDFSELVHVPLKPHGRFDIPLDERWWNDSQHHPFLIRRGDELCGFVLARRGSRVTEDWTVLDVAEFFVVRGARRRGVGQAAVNALLASLPGRWEVRVRRNNTAALAFWQRSLASLQPVPSDFEASGVAWHLFSFDTRSG